MAQITNNYAKGSNVFNEGSTQNGDVTVINQGEATPKGTGLGDNSGINSPIHLSKNTKKTELIRVMNAWYECGKVANATGGRLTKKEFFTWVGKLFNVDLENYDNSLSSSMNSGGRDRQLCIFEELKDRHKAIWEEWLKK